MIRCFLFGIHRWGEWRWVSYGLTIGSWYERECNRCMKIEQSITNPDEKGQS